MTKGIGKESKDRRGNLQPMPPVTCPFGLNKGNSILNEITANENRNFGAEVSDREEKKTTAHHNPASIRKRGRARHCSKRPDQKNFAKREPDSHSA